MSEDTVHLRLATEADRSRIVEISSQIWDGHDYVPELLGEFGFTSWSDGQADVYVYELSLRNETDARWPIGYDEPEGFSTEELRMMTNRLPDLSDQERVRYARHLVLPQIGEEGQKKLKAASVLVVGVGGLGSSIALYLVGAGVGHIGIVDNDVVSFPNLQRQILHGEGTLDRPKVESAKARLANLNRDVTVETFAERFDRESGQRIADGYDLIVDGTDNFDARYAINDVCLELRIPYVYGAIFRLEGQVSLLCTKGGPCYRCLFPEPPPPETVMTGEQAGILGAVPGTIGTLQATEAIKWIVGVGTPLVGRLLVYDAAAMRFEHIVLQRNADCPACAELPPE